MDPYRSVDLDDSDRDSLSRRDVLLRMGAGGLGVTLLAPGIQRAQAQDATPPAVDGLPVGVDLIPMSGVPIRDLPADPFTLVMYRITMEPGSILPNSALPYVSMTYTEKGNFVCPPGDEGRYIYDSEGKIVDSGAGEMQYPEGMWCYTAPNAMDGIRNDGTEPGSFLVIEFVPIT